MSRVFRPKYTVKTPTGEVQVRWTSWYYAEFTDARGKTRRIKAAPTASLAREVLRKCEEAVSQEKHGMPSWKSSEIPVETLKTRYLDAQKSRVVPAYYDHLDRRLTWLLTKMQAITVRDITPKRLETALATLSKLAPHTVNLYLQAVKGMLNWAVETRIIPFNPIAALKPRPQEGNRRNRRALTQEELARLFEAALIGPSLRIERVSNPGFGNLKPANAILKGERNTLIYRILAYTGLRVGELRLLRWGDLDFDAETLTVRQETSKNGRRAVLAIPPGLLNLLKAWKAKGSPSEADPVVHIPEAFLKTFNADLKLAGIAKKDANGHTVDLHSLRHTYGTLLIRSGADIKTVQTLMRHATASMTLGVYVHADQSRMREAVRMMPEPGLPPRFGQGESAEIAKPAHDEELHESPEDTRIVEVAGACMGVRNLL